MGAFFDTHKVIGLIDKHTGKVEVLDKIDIILTPSFYWLKRAYLEVRLSSQALKYAPSIFEGILPEGDYAYYVVKGEKEFLFFAYDPDEIIANLKSKGIQPAQIGGIYFAQNEMMDISVPIQCNKDDVLVLHNDTILQVSKYLVDESLIKRDLDDIKDLSKHKITLHKSSVTHSIRALTPLMSVLSALIILYAVQLYFTYDEFEELKAQPSVFSEYRLPTTFMQNSSIEKKLRKNFKAQKSFRKLIYAILQLPLSQRQRIDTIAYEKEQFLITFSMENYARLRDIELHLKKSLGKLVKVSIENNAMKVKIK